MNEESLLASVRSSVLPEDSMDGRTDGWMDGLFEGIDTLQTIQTLTNCSVE
jgi:hypothetical protein